MTPGPIAPLAASDLSFTRKDYGFVDLTANELGGTDQLLAAIDATAAEFAQSIPEQAALIASMAGDLEDLGSVLREIDTGDFESVLGELAGAAAAGDTLAGASNTDLPVSDFFAETRTTPAAPPAQPRPPTTPTHQPGGQRGSE